ncbi:MAG TPA: hypothetical protein VKS78_06225 [Roseiarcus sp.]|nr:hypothetical protein [Roseiarcus sp.]
MPPPRLTGRDRALRRDRIFARLLEGQAVATIAAEEGVTARRVRQIVQESLARWDADPAKDYAGVQIARLEAALRLIELKIGEGDVRVVDKLVKVLGQLDKYHLSQLRLRETYIDEEDREAAFIGRLERLAAGRAAVAARFAGARSSETASVQESAAAALSAPSGSKGAAESAAGKEIAPQSIEKARSAEMPAVFVTRNFNGLA